LSSNKTDEDKHIKRMADLLRQGTTLTELACPACFSPLFRLKDGTLWCAKCEKKVVVVREGEEPAKATSLMTLDALESTLMTKVQNVQNKMQNEENPEELQKLGRLLSELLENLERVRKIKRT
jgi:UPF0148 protein